MSRKRKSDQVSTETATATEAPVAAESATAVAEPPLLEAKPEGRSFAEKVGEKKRLSVPDPYGIAKDYLANVSLFESRQDRQMAIQFGEGRPEDKPSQAVIDTVKAAGYRWNAVDKIWAHPVRGESAMSTRIEAEELFQEVAKMIRQEKGIETGPGEGVPF